MTLRTRVAIVVIVMLVGWVIVSPNRNLSTSESAGDKTTPTLQIRAAAPMAASLSANEPNGWAQEQPASRLQPPRSMSGLAPMPIAEVGLKSPPPLQPVRLLGLEFKDPSVQVGDRQEAATSMELSGADREPAELVIPPAVTEWHRIVNGDSLESIARTYLGDSRQAMSIYNANRDLLDSPEFLPIGLELRIPRYTQTVDATPPPEQQPDTPQPLVPHKALAVPSLLEEISQIPAAQPLTPIPSKQLSAPIPRDVEPSAVAAPETLTPLSASTQWRPAPARQRRLDGL